MDIDDAHVRIVGVRNELERKKVGEDEHVQMEQHCHPKQCKGRKEERNYFNFCCWFVYWQAGHIVAAIERLKKNERRKRMKFLKSVDMRMHCQILTCTELGNKD